MLKRKIGVRLNSSDTNVYGQTSPKKRNVLVNFVLTVAFVWLVVGAATVAVAASESDPGVVNFEMHCATCHAPNGSGDTAVGKSIKIPDLCAPQQSRAYRRRSSSTSSPMVKARCRASKAACPKMKSMPW